MNGVASAFSRAAAAACTPRAPPVFTARPVQSDRHSILIGSMIWVLVVFMIVPEGFHYEDLSVASAPAVGGALSRLLWLGLLGAGSAVILWRIGTVWLLLSRWLNPLLLGFLVLSVASVAWSIDPAVTARRLIRVFTIFIDSIAFVVLCWHAHRFQNVLRPAITAVLLVSVVFGLVWPNLAIHQDVWGGVAGSWHGLADHKNGFGDIACVGLIFWSHAWLSKESRPLTAMAGVALATLCMVLSRSSTALVAAFFALTFLALLLRSPPTLRRYMPYMVTLFVVALLAYSMVLLRLVPGLSLLQGPIDAITGKDATFTGRTVIWDILSEHISLHPYLGTGYGAYWNGIWEGNPSFEFMRRLNFYPGSAHNGYLDILNDLGMLGLLVLLGYLAHFVVQSLRLLRIDRTQASLYLALFIAQVMANLSESRWFNVKSVDFVIMTLATASLARTLLEHHRRASQPESGGPAGEDQPRTARSRPHLSAENAHASH